MGEIKKPQKVLPFLGLIFVKDFVVDDVLQNFYDELGKPLKKSEVIPFSHTTYYNKEMGNHLLRQWILFERLLFPNFLIDLKHKTNRLEKFFLSESGGRRINIDPGLLSLSNLILASTKNYAHRIYLGAGIYAEVTLIYRENQFRPLQWTYPDYREEKTLNFFTEVRRILKNKLSQEMRTI